MSSQGFTKRGSGEGLGLAGVSGLDQIDLGSLDDKGEAVKMRLTEVSKAVGIYNGLQEADRASAQNRARIDGMFDGVAPYDSAKLISSGQGNKTNLNFGEAQRKLDIALSSYVDLYSSLEKLVNVKTGGEYSDEEYHKLEVIGEELSLMMKRWPSFHSRYLELCTGFVKHGVSVSVFDNPDSWKFRVSGFGDMLIPRQSVASEDGVDIAVFKRSYHLHELWGYIKNEEAAKKAGWNPDEVKRVMMKNVKTYSRDTASVTSDTFERLERELKNNDLYEGYENPTVDVLHFLVREMDGTVSHQTCAKDKPEAFMYEKGSRYKNTQQAYIFFTYGIGTNGRYHSIRGLGTRIFPMVQTSNRLRCQMIDGAMISSSVMLKPENERSLEEIEFSYFGPYSVISPNVDIVEKAIPNLGTAVIPALEDMMTQMDKNTDTVSTYGSDRSSPYRSKMQVATDIDVSSQLSGASLNLFYSAWDRLMREVVRRVVSGKDKSVETTEFFRRCADRGVDRAFITSIDPMLTSAVRSIGGGSKANRVVALNELQSISGGFSEVGRKNLIKDIVSSRVGEDFAKRYVSDPAINNTTVDTKLAMLENNHLSEGSYIVPLSNELLGTHLEIHNAELNELLEGLNSGEVDPTAALDALRAFHHHLAKTIELASGDPNLQGVIAESKQLLQYAEEMINNTAKHLEAESRKAASEEGSGQAEQDEALQMKMQAHEVDMQIKREKAELESRIKAQKAEQDRALKDADAALKFRGMDSLPR